MTSNDVKVEIESNPALMKLCEAGENAEICRKMFGVNISKREQKEKMTLIREAVLNIPSSAICRYNRGEFEPRNVEDE